jgi:formate--tetrahydrofolate ligase
MKYHGGQDLKTIGQENVAALEKGIVNLERHVENVTKNYGIPCVVSINRFNQDTPAEIDLLKSRMAKLGVPVVLATHWADGSKGAAELARVVVGLCEQKANVKFVYDDQDPLWEKMNKIAKKIYRAGEVTADAKVRAQIKKLQDEGYGHYPVCVAKTQYSFSTDAQLRAAPDGHVVNVREVRLAAGAEFVVMICGDIMTMPGLPKVPSAEKIDLVDGKVVGLF